MSAIHEAEPPVTVAVIAISSASNLRRCLAAVEAQRDCPAFDVVVVYDPELKGVPAVHREYPRVRMVANEGQRTPLELASRALVEARSDLVLLTEDHCEPAPDWIRILCDAQAPDRAAVGGAIETTGDANPVEWAFYFVDFFRYMRPLSEGPAPSLSVCNVAYRRDRLDAIGPLWERLFHETAVNGALRSRFGALWLVPQAVVLTRRRVRLRDATQERYSFGRLFGCTRLEFERPFRRLYYVVFAPWLPVLLMGRMVRRAVACGKAGRLLHALPALTVMTIAWSWGEWLGYLTRRHPRTLTVAPETPKSATG